MNITADLITSILTQAGEVITCKDLCAGCEDGDIIIRFEDDTDITISIYYTQVKDLIVIGTVNRLGDYKVCARLGSVSLLDPDTFSAYLTLEVMTLELWHEINNMI